MNSSRGTSRIARATSGERTPRSWIWCATIWRRASLRSAMVKLLSHGLPQVPCPFRYGNCGGAGMETPVMERLAHAAAILDDLAASSRRYLWTDAFAVMTWVGLHERTGQS